MADSAELLEYTPVTKAREVDEEQGILRDLVALGPTSANGREYPESTQRQMLPLLEGRQSFADHARGAEPSVYHVLGVWRDCRVFEGKVRGDFHYFRSHPLAPRLVEAARRPELNNALGFSINARGRTSCRGGRTVVESIEKVLSIDCVAQPATVKGLYESRGCAVRKRVRDLIEALRARRPGYARGLREAAEAGVLAPDAMMDEPAAEEPAAEEPADHKQALKDACKAILDDDSLTAEEMIAKIKSLLKMINGDAPSSSGGGGDEGGEESRRAEAANLREQLARLQARERLRAAADEQGVRLSRAVLEAVRPDLGEAEARAFVAELRGAARPRSAPGDAAAGAAGSALTEGKAPTDPREFARFVKGR